jgi:hypothetical protein
MKVFLTLALLSASAFGQAIPTESVHPFFDKTNLALFSAEVLVRTLDAQSTRMDLTNPCKCYVESNTSSASSSNATQYAYSLGVAGAYIGGSYFLHRMGHHRLERILPMFDIAFDGHAVAHNYSISGKK